MAQSVRIKFSSGGVSHPAGNVEVAYDAIGTGVVATLADYTGITSCIWKMRDVPEGSTVSMESREGVSFAFTPDAPGTYLLQVVTNGGASRDQKYYGIYTDGIEIRLPAAGETTEEGSRGWASEVNAGLKKIVGAVNELVNNPVALVSSVAGRTGDVVLSVSDVSGAASSESVSSILSLRGAAQTALAGPGIATLDFNGTIPTSQLPPLVEAEAEARAAAYAIAKRVLNQTKRS